MSRLAVLLPLAFSLACTEHDEQLIGEVGVTRLYLVDSGLSGQSAFQPPPQQVQVAEWDVESATLSINGSPFEMWPAGETCSFQNTAPAASSIAGDTCDSGIVIEVSGVPYTISLRLHVNSMRLRRAKPVDLAQAPGVDFDIDGVLDDGDNCPFLWNPDQADDNRDSIGDACTTSTDQDADGDGWVDDFDNCVWFSNPGQEDTQGLGDDGIGDACDEEIAEVTLGGAADFELDLSGATLLQLLGQTTFIVVDFNNQAQGQDYCDWEAGSCVLANAVLCTASSSSAANLGCP